MKEYTVKQIKQLERNPYVFKVTKHKLYYTAKFKEDFWISYQAGNSPRKILIDFGFDIDIFGQKQIDSLVQHFDLIRDIFELIFVAFDVATFLDALVYEGEHSAVQSIDSSLEQVDLIRATVESDGIAYGGSHQHEVCGFVFFVEFL